MNPEIIVLFYRVDRRLGNIYSLFLGFFYLFSREEITHTAILIRYGDGNEFVITSNSKRRFSFIPYKVFSKAYTQKHPTSKELRVNLGRAVVDRKQIVNFIKSDAFKIGNTLEYVLWWTLLRYIPSSFKLMSCGLMVCYILRIVGFQVGVYVEPHKLYKEIEHGVDNYFRASEGGKEYAG
jgi:hypothetical protein